MKIKTAVGGKSTFNLSTSHTSTFEVGQVRPTYYHHLIPGDKISVDMSMKALTAPLVYPSFAKLNFVHRAFYVPYSILSPRFEDFYNNRSVNFQGVQTNVGIPYFYNRDIIKILIADSKKVTAPSDSSDFIKYGTIDTDYSLYHTTGNAGEWNALLSENGTTSVVENMFVRAMRSSAFSFGYDVPSAPSNFAYDFVYFLRLDTTKCHAIYCQLKPFGRFVMKCLDSLGYMTGFFFKDNREYTSTSSIDVPAFNSDYVYKCNGFSLLAFMKIIYDNYIPSQYANSSVFARIFNFIQSTDFYFGSSQDLFTAKVGYSTLVEDRSPLMDIVQVCLLYAWQVFAGSDYFTDAWYEMDRILSSAINSTSEANNYSSFDHYSPRGLSSSVDYDGISTHFSNPDDDLTEVVSFASETGHKWLKGLYNLFKRSNLAGTRLGESILAIFGVKVPSAQIQKSVYLGKKVNELIIYDVTQNATTSEKKLGDFAGKGLSVLSDGNNWTFEADDFGIFLILSSVVSEGGYVQGVDRINMITDNLDFYHPELEKTGNQPIDVMELIGPPSLTHPNTSQTITNTSSNYLAKNIYGFAPRYSFMKYPKCFLTGDFRVPHVGGGVYGVLNAYHGYRLLHNPNSTFDDSSLQGLVQTGFSPIAQREILFDNGRQYNRIFNVTDNEQDHIFAEMNFGVKLISPMLTLQDSIDLDGFREVGSANGETLD